MKKHANMYNTSNYAADHSEFKNTNKKVVAHGHLAEYHFASFQGGMIYLNCRLYWKNIPVFSALLGLFCHTDSKGNLQNMLDLV